MKCEHTQQHSIRVSPRNFSLCNWLQLCQILTSSQNSYTGQSVKFPTKVIQNFSVYSVFRLHRMHEMLTDVTDVCSVCLSVCQSDCHAAQIDRGACSVHCVPCVRGHSVRPSPNAFGFLFNSDFTDSRTVIMHHCSNVFTNRVI